MSVFIPKNEWPKTDLSRSFLLFAVRVRELVHPDSQDIYKIHALSTISKLEELVQSCQSVFNREYPKPTIGAVVEEVNEAIESDPILGKILKAKSFETSNFLISISDPTENISATASLLLQMASSSYKSKAEEELIGAIKSIKKKRDILLLSKLYVSHLLGRGFHRTYILKATEETFFSNRISRCTLGLIKKFFSFFRDEKRKYDILAVESEETLGRFTGHLPLDLIRSVAELEDRLGFSLGKQVALQSGEAAVIIEDVLARDPYAAVRRTDFILSFPSAFHVVYPATQALKMDGPFFVAEKRRREITKIEVKELASTSSSYTSRLEVSESRVSSFSGYLWAGAFLEDPETYFRIKRSLDTAAQAFTTENPQIQLITLWSAIEAILPEPTKDEQKVVRISHFLEQIVPPVVARYLRGRFRILYNDIPRHVHCDIEDILAGVLPAAEGAKRLAFVLAFSNQKSQELAVRVAASPIILNRLFALQKLLFDPKLARKKMDRHEIRVRWQIQRIYRERNLIVHSGRTSPNTPTLAENLMLYYRLLVRAMHEMHSSFDIHSPRQALVLLRKRYDQRISELTDIADMDDDNQRKRRLINCIFAD